MALMYARGYVVKHSIAAALTTHAPYVEDVIVELGPREAVLRARDHDPVGVGVVGSLIR
jgi:hypothetical protein